MVDKNIEEVMTDKIRMKTLLNDDNFVWYLERILKVRRESLVQQLAVGIDLNEKEIKFLQIEIKVLDRMLLEPFICIQIAEYYEEDEGEEGNSE